MPERLFAFKSGRSLIQQLYCFGPRPHLLKDPMKYEVRWSNGFWKTFDTSRYESVAVHYSQAEAVIAVSKANG